MKTLNAPSHDECLSVLLQLERLLDARGPGKRKRVEKAMQLLRTTNDYEVELTMPAGFPGKAGSKVTLKAREVGSCCDPTTERYWSM